MKRKEIAIFGCGPSALIAAYFLADDCNVTLYEKEKNIGQKFLVAGKGGFNLTNSLTQTKLADKYIPKEFLREAILDFDSSALRKWLDSIGVSTFVGTSGRVFSNKYFKPINVLDKITQSLTSRRVKILTGHKFISFNKNIIPVVKNKNAEKEVVADYYIFSLGGSSWQITGSDGKWVTPFNNIGVHTLPFQASNCGVNINWSKNIIKNHTGKPLKNIRMKCDNSVATGEAVITETGLEGNVVYSLIPQIRARLASKQQCSIAIDFKPHNSTAQLLAKLIEKSSPKDYKKILNLKSVELSLIKSFISKDEYFSKSTFVEKVKNLEVPVVSLRPIEEAISTVGGIDLDELNPDFSLKRFPNIFTIGEMVDWDAPTGGFLLQGCFSMGRYSAISILKR